MKMGKEGRAKEGKWRGGMSPIGYDYIDGELVINEFSAMQVRELFNMFNSGIPLRTIEKTFLEKGYKNQYGHVWHTEQMRRTLTNRVYIGLINHKDQWYQGNHEPIIDLETFEAAEKAIKDRQKVYGQRGLKTGINNRTTYLGGLLWCARCGARYCKASSGGRYGKYLYNYNCYSKNKKMRVMIKDPNCDNKTWRMEELDNIVIDEIRKLSTESIKKIKRKVNNGNAEIIKNKIRDLDNQISRFLDLYGLGKFSVEQLDAKVKPLEEQRKKLLIESNKLDSKPLTVEEAFKILGHTDEILERGDFNEIRGFITSLISRIDIDGENITIHWTFI